MARTLSRFSLNGAILKIPYKIPAKRARSMIHICQHTCSYYTVNYSKVGLYQACNTRLLVRARR